MTLIKKVEFQATYWKIKFKVKYEYIIEFFDTTGEMIKNHIEFCENKKEQSITLDEILNIQAHKW